jgi:hypothetical protein
VIKFNPRANAGEAIEAASICVSPCQSLSPSSKVVCTIALYLALAGIIADPTTCRAQSRSAKTPVTSEIAITPDVDAAQNEIANPTYDNDPIKEKATHYRANAADSWGPVPTKKLLLLIWHPTSCHTSTTDQCSSCQEPTREISAIALN